jgi:hypothetical protein
VELRDGDVGLVDEDEEVAGDVVEERRWRFAGKTYISCSSWTISPLTGWSV